MTRIEKNSELEKKLAQMNEKISCGAKRVGRRARRFLTCGGALTFVFVVFCVCAGWAVAATGLVEVPALSRFAYKAPEPIRIVGPGVPVETVLMAQSESALASILQQGGGEMKNRFVEFTLGESSLTATLRTIVEQSGIGAVDFSRVQVAIDNDRGIEIYLPVNVGKRNSAILAWVEINAADGVVSISPIGIRVGQLPIPSFILRGLIRPLMNQQIKEANRALSRYVSVSSINVFDGLIKIGAEFTVEIRNEEL